jgi:flagellar protein FliS
MSLSPCDAYLETQIATATPQRLRLMLIEAALRRARAAQEAWRAENVNDGAEAVSHCRNIISELISGIQPDQSRLAKQILGVYMFLFSTLVEAHLSRDADRLTDIIRVLEEERQTWQAVCEEITDRPVASVMPAEEVAPQRVAEAWTPGYTPHVGGLNRARTASDFSIEA